MSHVYHHSSDVVCEPGDMEPPRRRPSGVSLLLLPPRALAAGLQGAAEVLRKTLDGHYADACPVCQGHHGPGECAQIPETPCPSPCVCRIDWVGCPGDSFQHRIQVTNTADTGREFSLRPEAFPCTGETVAVSPDSKTLEPGESLQAVASFTIPDSFGGSIYRTRIRVVGAYEQYILLCLRVRPHQACCCYIEQGRMPKRIRAHRWFHHFQCEEDCFEPAGKQNQSQ